MIQLYFYLVIRQLNKMVQKIFGMGIYIIIYEIIYFW